jgi:hypothetical protein
MLLWPTIRYVLLALIVYNLMMGNLYYESLRIQNETEQARLNFIRIDLDVCLTFATIVGKEYDRATINTLNGPLPQRRRAIPTCFGSFLRRKG